MLIPTLVLAILASYSWYLLPVSWIHSDDGLLAHCAERVLDGQVPHRDFEDPYSGLLSLLNAATFYVCGTSLFALRIPLFVCGLLFLGTLYRAARRIAPLWIATLACVLCFAWGTRHAFTPMPSWYNLFCAGFGALATLRFAETRRARWLFVAGICGGISICFKVIGLFYVAAILMSLAYFEQTQSQTSAETIPARRSWYTWLLTVAALAYGGLVAMLIRRHWEMNELTQLLLPNLAASGLLMATEWSAPRAKPWLRLQTTARLVGAFLAGVVAPVMLFVAYFALHGALRDLWMGLFVAPQKRLDTVTFPLVSWRFLAIAAPLVGLWLMTPRTPTNRVVRRVFQVLGAVVLLLLITLSCVGDSRDGENRAVLFGGLSVARTSAFLSAALVRTMVPALTVGAAYLLMCRREENERTESTRFPLAMWLFLTAACSLTMYPFGKIDYFLYFAPLAVMLALAAHQFTTGAVRMRRMFVVSLFALATMAVQMVGIYETSHWPRSRFARMESPRGNIRIPVDEARCYDEVVKLVSQHSRPDDFIFAGPDCLEVYFLSARRNPSATFYDEFFEDRATRVARARQLFQQHDIPVVVINDREKMGVVEPLDPRFVAELKTRYPYSRRFGSPTGKQFLVMLREPPRVGGRPRPSENGFAIRTDEASILRE